jgi:hypothetical protein
VEVEENTKMKVTSLHPKKMRQGTKTVVMMKQQALTQTLTHRHHIIMGEKQVQVHLEAYPKMIMNK